MAFTAKILSWRFRHLNIAGRLFAQKKAYQGGGGSRAPQDPPSYAPGTSNMAKLSRPSLMDVRNIRIHLTFIGN